MAANSDLPSISHATLGQSYCERSYHPDISPLAAYLLRLMHFKQTNLCVSADVTTSAELLRVAEEVGDHICILKTHADIVRDFGDRTIRGLNEVARRRKFLVFEDRKFGDIGNTVQQQYVGGPLTIVRWAPIVNAHIFPGPAIIDALEQAANQAIVAFNSSVHTDISASPAPSVTDSLDEPIDLEALDRDDPGEKSEEDIYGDEYQNTYDARYARKQSVVSVSTTISMKSENATVNNNTNAPLDDHTSDPADRQAMLDHLGPPPYLRSLLLLAQMSSANNFFTAPYTKACLEQARLHRGFVMGFIAQQCLNEQPDDIFITMTPGVQLSAGGDGMGQQYNTPSVVVGEKGTDVIIVGRGILAAPDRTKAAREYQKQGWEAYLARVRGRRAEASGQAGPNGVQK
ncbi:Orotidine 5'-phosphate decarboxylase [Dissoconium aciculare CBS 342.82]|uniref:Orotidine 5'-phosphate decarboxylase n=1 Tax=Dissoconium aciculare CBS 342.82 TaxID=1314786 RepID=A0A6J3LWC8_9PEZI|nr:Orotidine 5'-phosphate decarboxylase [Dissoconium aciculare CBS 342.82]KAF1819963.1 Orotidine 5'-phosphate decarboxylase [Dissoconium aciculare CBS 342.82]